ncbi:MAG TPA: hypothetical protein VID19_05380 [Candidatus Eremiobacteraceae bacterium]|jgi:photosystem II stability/assembly factor-like uncharacterized protein
MMTNTLRRTAVCACAAIAISAWIGVGAAAAPVASAGIVDPSLFADLHWRLIGPFRGGRALAVTGVPGNPTQFYFGAVAGGVWSTNDAGRTWKPIFDNQSIASIGAIALAPSDPRIIYVGTGEADMRSDITYGDGVYKSMDAGATWQHVGLRDTRQIGRIIVDPTNPNVALVAALGHAYGPNEDRGVFRTTDGGTTWQKVLYKDANTGAIDLAYDASDPHTVFAALWQTRRPPWSVYPPSSGPGTGLYVSHDGGSTWQQISGHGFPSAGLGRIGLSTTPGDPKRVYAIVDATAGGLYRSDDGGANWRLQNADRRLWGRGWYFCKLAADPKNADTIYVSDTAFYRSTDGGAHFTAIKGSPDGDDFHQPWIDPTDSNRIILGSDQGASISLNGGATWSSWFNQPTGQFYHVATDDRYPFDLFGAQQDNGSALAASQSDALGLTMFDWTAIVAGGESGSIAPDPLHQDVVFGDNVTKETLSNHQLQSLDPTITYPTLFRSEWTLPLVFSQTDPRVLYYGRQVIFRSADGGATWRAISPDLTRPNPGVPASLDPPTAADNLGIGPRRGVVYTIAPSPIKGREIWAGTDDGKIWLTNDEGAHWRDVTPAALGPWSKVGIIEASAFDASTAYVAVDRHRLDDVRPYIYRTRDGGKSWTFIANGIPAGAFVNAVREDPARPHLLYAGTELGVYVSFTDGAAWQPLQLNLPVTPVRDLAIRRGSLAIATHGRGFWVLDDLSPLYQLSPRTAAGRTRLFAPETAIRVRPHGDPAERLPPEEPAGQNRPVGAYIDYFIGSSAQSTPVTLQVCDATGSVVRRYSSSDRAKSVSADSLDFPSFWANPMQPPQATPGMHRYLWDFAYAAPAILGDPPFGPGGDDGVLAPPGRYTVQLMAAGRTYSQPLNVIADPRVKVSGADLALQFRLAREIESLRVLVAQTAARAKALRTGLSPTDAKRHKLDAIIGGPQPGSPDNSLGLPSEDFSSLWYLDGALQNLTGLVESADTAPTPDEVKAFEMYQAGYRAAAARVRM